MRRFHDDEAGFTLPELIMSIALLMIIAAPLMLSFVTSVRYIGKTDEKFTDTRGGLLSAAYFPTDVANANTITLNDPTPCGGNGAGLTALVSFSWSDASAGVAGLGTINNESSWIVDASQPTNVRLLRKYCANGSVAVTSQSVPAVSLAGNPVVTCYDPASVVDATCASATRWVKMVITGKANAPTPDTPSPVQATFTLEGTRRSK